MKKSACLVSLASSSCVFLGACSNQSARVSPAVVESGPQGAVTTAPTTVVVNDGSGNQGQPIMRDIGEQSFSQAAIWLMNTRRVTGMKLDANGNVKQFEAVFDLPPGYPTEGPVYLSSLRVSKDGRVLDYTLADAQTSAIGTCSLIQWSCPPPADRLCVGCFAWSNCTPPNSCFMHWRGEDDTGYFYCECE